MGGKWSNHKQVGRIGSHAPAITGMLWIIMSLRVTALTKVYRRWLMRSLSNKSCSAQSRSHHDLGIDYILEEYIVVPLTVSLHHDWQTISTLIDIVQSPAQHMKSVVP